MCKMRLGLEDYKNTITIIIINDMMCVLYRFVRLASLRYDLLICYTTYTYALNMMYTLPICLYYLIIEYK